MIQFQNNNKVCFPYFQTPGLPYFWMLGSPHFLILQQRQYTIGNDFVECIGCEESTIRKGFQLSVPWTSRWRVFPMSTIQFRAFWLFENIKTLKDILVQNNANIGENWLVLSPEILITWCCLDYPFFWQIKFLNLCDSQENIKHIGPPGSVNKAHRAL